MCIDFSEKMNYLYVHYCVVLVRKFTIQQQPQQINDTPTVLKLTLYISTINIISVQKSHLIRKGPCSLK